MWMEESEEQPIIPDPVAVDPSLPANQTAWQMDPGQLCR